MGSEEEGKMKTNKHVLIGIFGMIVVTILLGTRLAAAHCDTLDGPVVKDARKALEKGEVTPVLKWVRPVDEKEIREQYCSARFLMGL
jgi:hypothetical protein